MEFTVKELKILREALGNQKLSFHPCRSFDLIGRLDAMIRESEAAEIVKLNKYAQFLECEYLTDLGKWEPKEVDKNELAELRKRASRLRKEIELPEESDAIIKSQQKAIEKHRIEKEIKAISKRLKEIKKELNR